MATPRSNLAAPPAIDFVKGGAQQNASTLDNLSSGIKRAGEVAGDALSTYYQTKNAISVARNSGVNLSNLGDAKLPGRIGAQLPPVPGIGGDFFAETKNQQLENYFGDSFANAATRQIKRIGGQAFGNFAPYFYVGGAALLIYTIGKKI